MPSPQPTPRQSYGRRQLAPLLAAVLAAFAALVSAPVDVHAQTDMEMLFGKQAKPFIDPAGFFAVILPGGFDCRARARHAECQGTRGAPALLVIDVADVPSSATADLVLLNEMDRFKAKPHFKLLGTEKMRVDNSSAVLARFSYDFNGNVELAYGVQALYLVRGGKRYVIHLETRLNAFQAYRADIEQVYASFKPAELDAGGNPILEDLRPKSADDANGSPDVNRALRGGF